MISPSYSSAMLTPPFETVSLKSPELADRFFSPAPPGKPLWSYWKKMKLLVSQLCPTLCDPVDCSPHKLLCPWDFPGKNAVVGHHSLLQRTFPTQGLNPGLLRCRQVLFFFFSFIFISWRLITLQYLVIFAILWHESAMDLHVFPIPIPPPASLPIPSLWVFPVHKPWRMDKASSYHHWFCLNYPEWSPKFPRYSVNHISSFFTL